MNAPDRLNYRRMLFDALLAAPAAAAVADDPNRALLASMLAGQAVGDGCLPADLGLGEAVFGGLLASYFSGFDHAGLPRHVDSIPEWADLQQLLLDHRDRQRESATLFANIVATACAGRDHLWQDLGLINRDELTQLMRINFPSLALANSGDMKWKKFLYRQFCAQEGIYVCPAPSCGVCKDYAKCFGPEN